MTICFKLAGESLENVGILNLIKNSEDDDFLIFNPDTVWSRDYILEIKKMQNFGWQVSMFLFGVIK